MINPVSLTITSAGTDRHLIINPVYLQASTDEPLIHTETFLIDEEITPFEGMTDEELSDHLTKTSEPGYDPDDDLLHLGAIVFASSERITWKWDGKSPGFSGEEMEVLINFIIEYFEEGQNGNPTQIPDGEVELPMPPDTFSISINLNGVMMECAVANFGEAFEIVLPAGHVLLSIDENMTWRQAEGIPLSESLVSEIGYKINSFYE